MSRELTHEELLEVMRDGGYDVESAEIADRFRDPQETVVSVRMVVYGRKGALTYDLQFPFQSATLVFKEVDIQ